VYEELSWVIVINLRCSRVPGSSLFPFIIIPILCPCSQSKGLSIVKFTGLQVPREQLEVATPF
jgi:hypothetical protein